MITEECGCGHGEGRTEKTERVTGQDEHANAMQEKEGEKERRRVKENARIGVRGSAVPMAATMIHKLAISARL